MVLFDLLSIIKPTAICKSVFNNFALLFLLTFLSVTYPGLSSDHGNSTLKLTSTLIVIVT